MNVPTTHSCNRCKLPVDLGEGPPLPPGSVVLHAACSREAHEEACARVRRESARVLPDVTYRVVGTRPDGTSEPVACGLGLSAASSWGRTSGGRREGFARYHVEPEL